VLILTNQWSKAEALNFGLEHIGDAEFFVGIDADTIIAPDAIVRMVPHFLNPKVAAVAGNAKVGNRVNLWTRWQALEYITSQNFERRALNTMGAVSVVRARSARGVPRPFAKPEAITWIPSPKMPILRWHCCATVTAWSTKTWRSPLPRLRRAPMR